MMSAGVLDRLSSEEFALAAGFLSTPSALRHFLRRTKEVGEIGLALKQGAITDDTLREFVSRLMQDFQRGERFMHQLVLAALAVAVERRPTEFAEEFLHDLARLQVAEMTMAIRVARECLRNRMSLAAATAKTRSLGSGNGAAAASGTAVSCALGSGQTIQAFLCGAP
jgi:hypothetical protein